MGDSSGTSEGFVQDQQSVEVLPPIVVLNDSPLQIGRGSGSGLRLLNPTISRSHAVVQKQNGVFVLRDLDSRYGTCVNGARVGSKALSEGDIIRFGTSTHYRFTNNSLVHEKMGGGYSLSLRDVCIVKGGRLLVADASFDIPANSFVGILGPSGSGKSTLLSVLASYHHPVAGTTLFDEAKPIQDNLDDYRAALGNVPQQDIVYSGLTARENLFFSARLRSSQESSFEALRTDVDRVLKQVGLSDHADKPFERLSGGQQKRVSVAVELLKRPRLLLLDEPTSGLDPAAEAGLMEQLKVIASQGTTVVCTTHHMDNVALFDMLVVVGVKKDVGRVAYVGDPEGFLKNFACHSYADAFERLRDGGFEVSPESSNSNAIAPSDADGLNATIEKLSSLVTKAPDEGVIRQAGILAERGFLRVWRDKALVAAMIAQPLILGLLISLTQYRAIDDGKLLKFFLCVMAVWLGLNNSARDLVRERKHYIRERLAGLSPDAYLLSKFIVFVVIGLLQTIVLMIIVDFSLRFFWDPTQIAYYYGEYFGFISIPVFIFCLFASYLCGLGMGLLASTLARTEEAAVAVLPLLIMPQILISPMTIGPAKDDSFKHLIVSLTEKSNDVLIGRLVDDLSMSRYSRPGLLVLHVDEIKGAKAALVLGDYCHLIGLLIATWAVLYFTFRLIEEKWPRLLGLG